MECFVIITFYQTKGSFLSINLIFLLKPKYIVKKHTLAGGKVKCFINKNLSKLTLDISSVNINLNY